MKTDNKKRTQSTIVLIQIFILVISIVAFTQMISAQTLSTPLPTSIARKTIIQSNESNQESQDNLKKGITGASFLDIPILYGIGELGGETIVNFAGGIGLKLGALATTAFFVFVVWLTVGAIVSMAGGDWDSSLFYANAFAASTAAALVTANIASGFAAGLGASGAWVPGVGWAVGIVTAIWTLWTMTMKADARAVIFDCKPWQSQTGGDYCDQCDDGEFPCTEYKCKSLGQACELINEGDNARCIYKDRGDTTAPSITARVDSLLSEDYSYNTIQNGVEIQYNGDCLPSFESFTFGVELDKEGRCMVEDHRTDSYSDMLLPFGSERWEMHHTQMLSFPVGGNYEYYVRCESVNGYTNVEEFLFKFCIDSGDDIGEPTIQGFNLLDKTPIKWFSDTDLHETDVTIYVNEPLSDAVGGCKWSHNDKSYEEMEEIMTSCSDSISEFAMFNSQISYTCSATLTGLQNSQENKFYFRCKDAAGNINTQSKELTLVGSRPLLIDSVSPEGTVKGASESVKVTLEAKTSAGYEDGEADCYYSDTGDYNDYTRFTNTRSYTHSTDIYLEEGDYTYHIQCLDMAGNLVVVTTNLKIETDFTAPIIVRAYHEGGDLNLITSESAQCVYDTTSCTYIFEDGIGISSGDNLIHSVAWNTNSNLYIKCKDEYGNQPAACSIILRPFEFF